METGYMIISAAAGFIPPFFALIKVARSLKEGRKTADALYLYKVRSQENIRVVLSDIAYHQGINIGYKINQNTGAVACMIDKPKASRDAATGRFVKPKTYAYEVV